MISAKHFRLELDGTNIHAFADNVEIPNVKSFYLAHDPEDHSYEIELNKVDERGYMELVEVLLSN